MSAYAAHERALFRGSICCPFVFLMLFLLSSTPSVQAGGAQYPEAKRPVTVGDAIRMTRWPWGALEFSPDSEKFVVVLRKGNVESNKNEYSLLLWQTNEVFQSPPPRILLTMSSSSNREAITDVKWLGDNETIAFLGENPGEGRQLYEFNIRAHSLRRVTKVQTNVVSYSVTPDGQSIAFVAEEPVSSIFDERARRDGVLVSSQ